MDKETRTRHPSFGQLEISRVTSSRGVPLYGSSLRHSNYIQLSIHESEHVRSLNQNNYFLIGAGFNILQEKFEISNAGSLLTQTGRNFNLNDFTIKLHDFLTEKLKNIPSEEEILKIFNENLFRKDEISVFELEKTRQNGIIRKADENGELWIDLENDGLQSFYHKEIKLLY
jgi:BirA family biotin operon repressor/biotin-[acetyl-CoA-carboxylase] ligase